MGRKSRSREGEKYGRLTVTGRDLSRAGYWICRCDCGTTKSIRSTSLYPGRTQSCGCLALEVKSENGKRARVHGMRWSRAYSIWLSMRTRCNNPKADSYARYGERGIKIDPRWDDFQNFLSDMGEPLAHQSIDRINNDLGYGPNNCRWADKEQQMRNQSSNHWITINGETKTLTDWSAQFGVNRSTAWSRIKRGVDPVLVFTKGKSNG